MTSKELFSNFIRETMDYPYFSTLYDLDMWREDKEMIEKDLEKLSLLEDIEEELGIGLITLFKALKDGIWTKQTICTSIDDDGWHITEVLMHLDNLHAFGDHLGIVFVPENVRESNFNYKDYGKTWALTKEELENE